LIALQHFLFGKPYRPGRFFFPDGIFTFLLQYDRIKICIKTGEIGFDVIMKQEVFL